MVVHHFTYNIQNGVENQRSFNGEFRTENTKPIFLSLRCNVYRFINHFTLIHILISILFYVILYLLEKILYSSH